MKRSGLPRRGGEFRLRLAKQTPRLRKVAGNERCITPLAQSHALAIWSRGVAVRLERGDLAREQSGDFRLRRPRGVTRCFVFLQPVQVKRDLRLGLIRLLERRLGFFNALRG